MAILVSLNESGLIFVPNDIKRSFIRQGVELPKKQVFTQGDEVMNRVPVVITFMLTVIMLAAVAGLVSCSHSAGTDPVTVPDLTGQADPPSSPSGEGITMGYFQFEWDEYGNVTVEEADAPRGADINVTAYASMIIEDFFFDDETRNWYITATIRNISPFTGYDVWAVFHSLGNKFVTNQDGFLWALPPIFPNPTRCAFIAYGKDQPDRVFPPMFQDTRTIVIHQPEGIPKLAPIGFWIDATINPRVTPGVENLMVEPIDDTNYHLTGFVWDHQSPSEDLTVFADCTNFNGQGYVQMFDDGLHGDGMPDDSIWGGDFDGDPEDGHYVITVYAMDPQQNQGENDVGFWHGDDVPCDLPIEHWPYETIDKGEHCGIDYERFEVINDWLAWEMLWLEHTSWIYPPPPIPPINFDMHSVIGVWIGPRPSNNHHATIVDIQFDPCEELVTVFYEYTPYTACGPLDVMTDPFHIVVVPKYESETYFVGEEVPCPGPPPECIEEIPWETVIQGFHSAIKEPYELRISNWDQFEDLWLAHTQNTYPPPPVPEINFEDMDLIAIGIGERPTSGFECVIKEICWLENQTIGVFYKERIPGPDCDVYHVLTQPFHWAVIPKIEAPVEFFKHNEVYNCGPGDCDEPQMFWPIDQGMHTGHEAGNFVFKNHYEFFEFWNVHKPGEPMPPVMWQEDMVLAMLIGGRPSTGYFVETNEVCLNTDPDTGALRMDVKFTENIPGEDCIVMWIGTTPYQIVVVPRFEGPVFFHHQEHVYDCPSGDCDPVEFWHKADGHKSCEPQGQTPIWNPQHLLDIWQGIWCYPGELPPVPPINFEEELPFLIQITNRPTSGFYVTTDDVCVNFEEMYIEVNWTLWEPGPNCIVEHVITEPWTIDSIGRFPGIEEFDWNFIGHEEMYECPTGECVPVDFWDKADGDRSCEPPGQFPIYGPDAFMDVWHGIWCWEPPIPEPPSIFWEEEVPFIVQLGNMPSTGFYVTIDEVCVNEVEMYVEVDWTVHVPAPGCPVEDIPTQPWAIATIEAFDGLHDFDWFFNGNEEVYECGDCVPTDFFKIAEGDESCAETGEFGWQHIPPYQEYWWDLNCYDPDSGDPPPPLPE